MGNRMKSGLVIVATLVLGFLLGVMVDSSLHRRRFERLRELHRRGGIASVIKRRARPTPEQREELKAIWRHFNPRFRELRERHHYQMRDLLDSLHTELKQVLTPEQVRRLRRARRKCGNRPWEHPHCPPHRHGPRRGPPGPPPPAEHDPNDGSGL